MIPSFINAHQTLFIVCCWMTLAGAVAAGGAWLACPAWPAARWAGRWPIIFLGLLVLSVVLFRQPTLWRHDCQQMDGVNVLVAAQMLQATPVTWRDVDNSTIGPLAAYTLIPFYWLGCPPVPATLRLYTLLCQLTLLLGTGMALARLGGAGAAVPATLAVGLWVAFAKDMAFFEWNSEYLPAAMLVLAVALYARTRAVGTGRWGTWLGLATAGLLLGAVPYAKLQAVPLALLLTLVALVDLARSPAWAARRLGGVLAFCAGGLACPLVFTGVTLATGSWRAFTQHYFAFAQSHGNNPLPVLPVVASLAGFDIPWLLLFASGVTAGLVLLAGWRRGRRTVYAGKWILGAILYLLVALYAINAGRLGFHHYAILVVPPLVLLMGLLTGPAWRTLATAGPWGRRAALALLGLGVAGWAYTYQAGSMLQVDDPAYPVYGCSPTASGLRRSLPIPAAPAMISMPTWRLAQQLAAAAQPRDQLAVWGWAPQYFLESGRPNATRYVITVGLMPTNTWVQLPPALVDYYRQCYLADLQRRQPAWFIDAVSDAEFAFHDRRQYGHECWPALGAYIAANYVQAGELPCGPGNGTRVYLRRDLCGARPAGGGQAPAVSAP